MGRPMLGMNMMNLLGVPNHNFMFEDSDEEDEPLNVLNGN